MLQAIHTPANRELYAAYKFFKVNAGYCGERRAAGALDLARAERAAQEEGITFAWDYDQEPWEGDCPAPFEVLCCRALGPQNETLAALCGIGMTGDSRIDHAYRREVEAELASEALDTLTERESAAVRSL